LRTDREEYIVLKTKDTLFHQVYNQLVVTSSPIPTSALLDDIYVDALSPNAITVSGTVVDLGGILASRSLNQPGSQWTINIDNQDPVNDKVFTLPAGVSPATITVPANTYTSYTFEVVNNNPEQIRLIQSLPGGSGTSIVTSFTGAQGNVQAGPALVATAGDYTSTMVTNLSAVPGATVTDALNFLDANGVDSFTGAQGTTRTGAVTALAGDYNAVQVTVTPNVTGVINGVTEVQTALNLISNLPINQDIAASTPVGNGVGWRQMTLANTPIFRGSWLNTVNDITDLNPATRTIYKVCLNISTTVAVPAVPGFMGCRVQAGGIIIGTQITENDQTGGEQQCTLTTYYQGTQPTTFIPEVINSLGANYSFDGLFTVETIGNLLL